MIPVYPDPRSALGEAGEEDAAAYLTRRGLRIVDRHFQTRWGEIDIVARQRDTWVFVEVKTRSRAYDIAAVEAVHRAKQRRVVQAALSYMKRHRLVGQNMRFDVVLIEGGRLEWIPNAFQPATGYTV